jgi:hypothetical protein
MTPRPRIYAEHEPKPPAREFRARSAHRLANATSSNRATRRHAITDRKLDALLGAVDEDYPTPEEADERWDTYLSELDPDVEP